ncbi:acyl-CoA thioesterase [Cellulosilyticum ruminicola]|uniref:acyl-CoA thioesterase n=1 Tax=Cellulosilyticum ruminicola TaxID=425254 RepID=UPI0006CF94B1|nr:acyl-CoA thioesterase [Cellulosilyticum ruminicola]
MKYEHCVKFYETDQMGVVHHSNYIRWMEDARMALLKHYGFGYKMLESKKITVPVIDVKCRYKSSIFFDDLIQIEVQVIKYDGIKVTLQCHIYDKKTGKLRSVGESTHCFCKENNKPIYLADEMPALNELFIKLVCKELE